MRCSDYSYSGDMPLHVCLHSLSKPIYTHIYTKPMHQSPALVTTGRINTGNTADVGAHVEARQWISCSTLVASLLSGRTKSETFL